MKNFLLHLLLWTSIIALLLTAFSSPTSPELAVPPTTGPAQGSLPPEALSYGMVDVGGRRLSFNCTGQGSPTVILEAGADSASYYWFQVQSGSENSYRVCSYDRANLGYSDSAPKPRTYLDMAGDLHALLVKARIAGPYILVGHSGGGLLVRVFADQYPKDVVGLVLVDSAHPDMGSRLLAGLPPKSIFEPKAIREWRIWLTWMDDSHGSLYKDLEGLDTQTSNAQVKSAKPLGDLPLVVISRNPDNAALEGRSELPAETNLKLRRIWQDL